MTENYYTKRIRFYNVDHSTFGGEISRGDFDRYHSISDIAEHIISDKKFDEQCRRDIETRNRQANYNRKESGND